MRVVILGTRLIHDIYIIKKLLKESKIKIKEVITNGEGLGFYAQIFAKKNNLPCTLIKPFYTFNKKIKIDYKYKELIEASDMAFIIKGKNHSSYKINDFLDEAKKNKNYKVILKEVKI